ncbi:MAG: hypothetical protein OXI53_11380 [Nitrospira sp.]|nr:hypothetical protein [Nitrospira sp.]
MTDFDHRACEFFYDRCKEKNILPRRIRESRKPGSRRPDFKLSIDGNPLVVEVKAIEESENDRREGLHDVLKEDIPRIRKKLSKANRQLHRYSDRGIPGIVCIIDYTGRGLTWIPMGMHIAMFGQDAVVMSVPSDPTHPPHIVGQKSAGKETLTPEHNRSISAVLTFHVGNTDPVQYVSTLYHNHFARCLIDPNCAAHLVTVQYESGKRERSIGDPWIRMSGTSR